MGNIICANFNLQQTYPFHKLFLNFLFNTGTLKAQYLKAK